MSRSRFASLVIALGIVAFTDEPRLFNGARIAAGPAGG